MPKKWLLAPVCLFIFLSSACTSNSNQGNDNPAFAPQVNPNPKYFMTVKGNIDPALSASVQLQIIANFQTNNDECEYTVNKFEGISRPMVRGIIYTAKPDSEGNYKLKIPFDYYLQGTCKWHIFGLADRLTTDGGYNPETFITFSKPGELPKDFTMPQSTLVSCDNQTGCNWEKIGGYSYPLPANHNYIFQYNISWHKI